MQSDALSSLHVPLDHMLQRRSPTPRAANTLLEVNRIVRLSVGDSVKLLLRGSYRQLFQLLRQLRNFRHG